MCRFDFGAISVTVLNIYIYILDQVSKLINEDILSHCWRKET